MLIVSLLLVIIPLLGIGLMFYQDPAITVDNLFLSLMLLAISGVFMLNVATELKQRFAGKKKEQPRPEPAKTESTKAATAAPTVASSVAASAAPAKAEVPVVATKAELATAHPAPTKVEVAKVEAAPTDVARESVAPVSHTARGVVRDVQFFEAPVGVPNKSIVTLQVNGDHSARIFAFEGDLRSALPVGKKVEVTFRDVGAAWDLQSVDYL